MSDEILENQKLSVSPSPNGSDITKYNLRKNRKIYSIENSISQSDDENDHKNTLFVVKKINKEKRNARKRFLQAKWTDIEYPIPDELIFALAGHVLIEVQPSDNARMHMTINEIKRTDQMFSIFAGEIRSITNFGFLIHILEKSQEQTKYDLCQVLKQYQRVVQEQLSIINDLHKQCKNEAFQTLVQKRKEYKEQFIQNYVNEHLQNEDFYLVCNVGTNFNLKTSYVESLHFSAAYQILVGIDEDKYKNLFFRNNSLFSLLTQRARQQIYIQYLSAYLSNEPNKPIVIKDFEIRTLDGIHVYCDNTKIFLKLDYPDGLKHPQLDALHTLMDNVNITVVNVREQQIKYVIDRRIQMQKSEILEDFEYSVLSSIFLEKFYPEKLAQLEQEEQKQRDILKQEIETAKQEEKRCSYKFLNHQSQ